MARQIRRTIVTLLAVLALPTAAGAELRSIELAVRGMD